MTIIEFLFLFYMFVGLYMLSFFVLLHTSNRSRIYEYKSGKPEPVSIVMPCYNEGEHIGQAIESLLTLDWPKNMLEIIIVDDRSKDNSVEVIKEYVKKDSRVKLIINTRNSGKAAEPTNIGIKAAKYNYIAVADADSTPSKDALYKMIGFLQNDDKVAAVTCAVLAKTPKTFMQRLQEIEYSIIAWNRKLLDLVDAVYVTPGPFALYKKKILLEVGLFDTKNMTQDIEIVWRLRSHGYTARMCLATQVYSATPVKFKHWFKQRIRWNIGGLQTLAKYKELVFKRGMLGAFIIPFFSISLTLGLIGLGVFGYLFSKRVLLSYLSTKYSFLADTALVRLQDISFYPSVLNYFGFVLFIAGTFFTLTGLDVMNYPKSGFKNLGVIFFYMLIYLAIYPIIMIVSVIKLATGKYSW